MKNIISWFANNKKSIIGFAIGLIIGLIIMVATEDEEIAKLKDGKEPVVTLDGITITADDLYNDMKDYYSVSILLNTIDNKLFGEKYPDTGDVQAYIDNMISSYKTNYGDNFSSALIQSGFANEKEFRKVLLLDYQRTLASDDYLKEQVTEEEVNNYYQENVYGDINTKHILVKPDTKDDMSDEDKQKKEAEALNLAKEIITKLNDGKKFDEVKEEYKDSITYEELGYQAYNASLEQNYLNEMFNLKKDEYSKTPVKTSYGYHIIYKIDEKEKPELSTIKSNILSEIVTDKKANDSLLSTKTLFDLREAKKLTFFDSVLKTKYDLYKKSALTKQSEN